MFNRDLPRKTLLALSAALAIGSSVADDTEIFNSNPSLAATISSPNVLIILDNTSNWGNGANPQPFTDERAAMATVVGALAGMRIKANVGLMFQAAGATDGGYVRFAIRPMLDSTGNATTANTQLTALVNSLDAGNDKANNPTYAQTMAEAFYYFKGLTPRAGFGDIHRDCGVANTNNIPASGLGSYGYTSCGTADPNNTNQFTSPANSAGVTYVSPISTTDSCQKNYIIYISNGPISNNDGQVEAASNNPGYVLLRDAPASASSGQLATIPASPDTETRVNYADEWARYLNQTDLSSALDGKQNITTYTINVRPGASGQGPAHSAMMNSMAINGGGRPFSAVTQADIEEALMAIFNEIQNVNSVFAAVSLPVSVNVRGINANQVYVGMFRPDVDSLPRWPGNLKLYRLGVYNNNLVLSDQRTSDPTNVGANDLSINASSGQFVDQAISFWTTSSSFWSFNTSVGPTSSTTPASDSPDGPVVEKGGVAEVLRNAYASSQSTRKVFTCISTCTTSACDACAPSTALTTANSSTNFASGSTYSGATMQSVFGGSALGITSDTALTNLVNWIRGADNALSPGGENNNGSLTDIRASIHADVLHSRPIVINYGGDTAADNDVVIFYGANDGLLRAVKGGYSTVSSAGAATNGIAPGSEMWSFVAPEFFSKFVRQRDNSPAVTSESGLITNTYGSLTTTSGSPTVTGLTTAQTVTLARGMTVTGSGVPSDTYILGVGSTSITMSRNATSSSASALTFTPNPKDYFFDGPIGVYVKDVTSSANGAPNGVIRASETDQVILFVPMRRGGRWLYAFDVTTPTAPIFKWRIGCDNQGSCSGIDSELGQTWSEPKVVKIQISDTTSTGCSVATPCPAPKYVIVMGAGYDANIEDRDPIPDPLPGGVSRTQGRGIYVLDIADGSVIWKAAGGGAYAYTASLATVPGMDYPIPSDIAVIDRNGDGYADRAYVGDTGGNVWRVDMADTNRANWRVNKFASIGRAQYLNNSSLLVAPANAENNDINGNTRKFLSPPDVVPASGYDAILIGSGDREHPFNGYGDTKHPVSQAVQNRYYMFKDFDVGVYACNSALGGVYNNTSPFTCASDAVLHETQLADVTTAASGSLDSLKGWFISLGLGEKVTGSSVTLSGSTFFNTNIPTPPAAGVCSSNLGEARQYAVNYLTGGSAFDRSDANSTVDFVGDRYSAISSGGFLPSPVGLIVSIGGKLYQGIASGPNIQTPGGLKIGDRIKSYWRKRID